MTTGRKVSENPLIAWLNNPVVHGDSQAEHDAPSKNKVATLVRRLHNIERLLAIYDEQETDFFDFCPKDLQTEINIVNKALRDYPRLPGLEIMYRDQRAALEITTGTLGRRPSREIHAVYEIEKLVGAGEISRIQECACGTWFYVARADQKSCSAKCRHKLYEQTPEAQEKRKLYMQRYHRLRESGKVK